MYRYFKEKYSNLEFIKSCNKDENFFYIHKVRTEEIFNYLNLDDYEDQILDNLECAQYMDGYTVTKSLMPHKNKLVSKYFYFKFSFEDNMFQDVNFKCSKNYFNHMVKKYNLHNFYKYVRASMYLLKKYNENIISEEIKKLKDECVFYSDTAGLKFLRRFNKKYNYGLFD